MHKSSQRNPLHGLSEEPPLTALAARLHSLSIHLLRRVRVEDEASGLTPARLSALSVVVFAGPLRLGAVATAEGVSPPTMSKIVGALVDLGLVSRLPDPEDRRSVLLAATDPGRELLEATRSRRLRRLAETLTELSTDELTAVAVAVDVLLPRISPAASGTRKPPDPP